MVLAQNWTDPSGKDPAPLKDLEVVFKNGVNVILGFAGIALFVMLLVGGFKYLNSGGDPKAAESANKTITLAIAGLLVIVLSFLILALISKITGVDVREFKIVQ